MQWKNIHNFLINFFFHGNMCHFESLGSLQKLAEKFNGQTLYTITLYSRYT